MSVSLAEWAALSCALIWATNGLLLRTQSEHVTPGAMNAIRCAVAGAAFWLALPFDSVPLVGLLGMGVGAYLFIYAITQANPAKVVTLTSSSPLFGMLLAAVFLGEKITPQIALGMALCMGGVYAVL